MRESVRSRLRDVNRTFYDEHSNSFSSTRGSAWVGWTEAVPTSPETVLDIGCGNGRFLHYLDSIDDDGALTRYVGTDTSLPLLDAARRQASAASANVHFVLHDLEDLAGAFDASFALVVAFGVLHHVPGKQQRADFLRNAAGALDACGKLIVTCWQFQEDSRFETRRAPWHEIGLTESDVEPGDALLRWGDGGSASALRYCHATTPTELESLTEAAGLELTETFFADGKSGRLNLYAVLERA